MENLIPLADADASPPVKVMVIDGAAKVYMLTPGNAKTFSEYASQIFLPYITSQLQHTRRVDIVWDDYFPDSLKAETRKKRGEGIRRRVEPSSSIPGNWQAFLPIDENKVELFTFLATMAATIQTEKQINSTLHKNVLCSQPRDVAGLAPRSHEEADTRMLLHVADAVNQGLTKVSIRTVDTDVVILAVTAFEHLNTEELWIAFATGKNFRFLAAHEMAVTLGLNKCRGLSFFHAFTGCDNVSCFGGRGKTTAWETWKASDEVTDITAAFGALANFPTPSDIDTFMDTLERFVVLMYDRTSSQEHVNEARKHLFAKKGRSIENIPPTREALRQHIKRAAYQAGFCWAQMMVCTPELPSPSDWGWVHSEHGWDICWTTLSEATVACRQLLRCGCKKGCTGQCKCVKASLQYTALCCCGGDCSRE